MRHWNEVGIKDLVPVLEWRTGRKMEELKNKNKYDLVI
jgi:hypothetical protein